jgi:hypothetical protein
MKIEIKNIKHYESMSEETNCFQATIYIDGKKAGTASNRGYGDPINILPFGLHKSINDYAKTLPPINYEGLTFDQDAETLIGELLTDWLIAKDLKKIMSSRIIFAKGSEIQQTKKLEKTRLTQLLASVDALASLQADKILNNLPFDQALTIYKELAA